MTDTKQIDYEKNIKIYPIYSIFAYDVLFYGTISMLFLTVEKGISVADFLLIGSIYSIFKMIFQVPAAIVTDKIGLKNSMLLGNSLIIFWGITYLIFSSFGWFVIAEAFCAAGFALKGVSESPFIFTNMKHAGKQEAFSKLEGKANSRYFYVEALASIAARYSIYSKSIYTYYTFYTFLLYSLINL